MFQQGKIFSINCDVLCCYFLIHKFNIDNKVRGGFLQKYCECTGTYTNLLPNEDAGSLVKALNNFTK